MKKTFSDEVKMAVLQTYNGYCGNCLKFPHSFHHKLPNTKANQAKFPLFLHSPMNCIPLCFDCHTNELSKFNIKPELATVYENFLRDLLNDTVF